MKDNIAKATAKAIKEITLADIYDAIGQVKERQEEDFRYLNKRIDSVIQMLMNISQQMLELSKQK